MLKTLRSVKQVTVACSMFGAFSLFQIAALITNDKVATAQILSVPSTLLAPVKLCSAVDIFARPNSRDTISVPVTWNVDSCEEFAVSVKAASFQLGCAQSSGISWGEEVEVFGSRTSVVPPENCGW